MNQASYYSNVFLANRKYVRQDCIYYGKADNTPIGYSALTDVQMLLRTFLAPVPMVRRSLVILVLPGFRSSSGILLGAGVGAN